MSKGTAIDRVLTFYRTASADTVRVTHQLAGEVMAERGIGAKVKLAGKVTRRKRSKPESAVDRMVKAAGAASQSGGQ